MTNKKYIYGDIGAIKKHGLQSYINNYFWPVSELEYQNIANKMHEQYVHILDGVRDPFLYDVVLVELTFIAEIQIIYHYHSVKQYALKHNLNLHYTKHSKRYYEPDWKEYANFYSTIKFPHGRVVRAIRRFIKSFVFNRHLGFIKFIKGFLFGQGVIGVGSYDRLKKEYVEKNNLFCHHYDWPDVFKHNSKSDKDITLQALKVHKEVISPYLEFLVSLDPVVFSKELIENIRISWDKRIKDLIVLFYNCSVFDRGKVVLITEAGKPHSKIISLVNNRYGAKAYCFHHGSDMGEVVQKNSHTKDTSHCRYFIVPSSGAKSAYIENYSNISVEKKIGTHYISNKSTFYKELYDRNLKKKLNSEIKSVMVIGYPMTPYRPMEEVGLFFYIRLEFEHRLIKELKNKGYRVLYKAHPDRLNEITGFFEGLVDEFLVEPFERVWDKADALIYGLTSTSTFGYGLCTNLPITLIDVDGTVWNKRQKKYLEGRVSFVPAKLNKEQQIEFSSNNLIDTLRKPKSAIKWNDASLYFG